ncbi:MAG TPA: hypothetical protein DD643_01160 [Synechococcus sp. UBA8638]|nr:hypothetical protein [Synechococcus sp. UBA8638]
MGLVADINDLIPPQRQKVDTERIWEALEAARLADLIAKLPHGLMTAVGENGVQFSGGQRPHGPKGQDSALSSMVHGG